jgi:hypothetical protein
MSRLLPEGDLLVRVTAHRGYLIIEAVDLTFRHPNWVPENDNRIGCKVLNSAKFVGISAEALNLLKKVKKGWDDIGDLMWWQAGEDWCFGWLGPNLGLVDYMCAVADRDFNPEGPFVTIPNDANQEARGIIDYNLAKQEMRA